MSESSCAAVVRNVFASNNIGVALLSNNCYMQAAETFHEVLKTLRELMAKQTAEELTALSELADLYYHQAMGRISKPEPFQNHAAIPYQLTVVTWSSITSDCYVHPKEFTNVNDKKQQCDGECIVVSTFPETLYSFRIEDVDTSPVDMSIEGDEDLQAILKVEASIIMHNFGLAHMYLAEAVKVPLVSFTGTASPDEFIRNGPNNRSSIISTSIDNETVMKNKILASRLLAMSASLCLEENTEECVANYSVSSDGSVVLQYIMSNIQCFISQASQSTMESERLVSECRTLNCALLQMGRMMHIIKQWNELFVSSSRLSSSDSSITTNQLPSIGDSKFLKAKPMCSLNVIAPAA